MEFLLQYLTLQHAAAHPGLSAPRDTPGLIEALRASSLFDDDTADALAMAITFCHTNGSQLNRFVRRVPGPI